MSKADSNEDFLLGGQAVLEGVLMRSPNYSAVAVRRSDGAIVMRRTHQPNPSSAHKILSWPLVRGVVMLGHTLAIGIGALNFSAAVLTEEEAEAKGERKDAGKGKADYSKLSMALTLTVAFLFAFVLIVFLPLWLTDLLKMVLPALQHPVLYNAVDGLFRVAIFLAYILLISLMPDIRRVFEYHGAEHMSVYASEDLDAGQRVTVEEASRHSPYHPRCGTSFLLLVMIVAIVLFSLTPTEGPFWLKLLIRTPLIPLIAGVSYEILKLTAKLRGKWIFSALSAPGMWLQRLTARHPDHSQLEVAVIALNEVIDLERRFEGQPLPPDFEQVVPTGET